MTFETAIAFVLNEEGGYSNDPRDPGGETNFGISKRAHPQVDIKNLTLEEAESIYRYEHTAWDLPSTLRVPICERGRCLPHIKHDMVAAPKDADAANGDPDTLDL